MEYKKLIGVFSLIITAIGMYFIPTFLKAEEGFLTQNQAKTIAKNFIKFEKFKTWENVSIKGVWDIYSSNDIIIGYEMSIHDKNGNDMGYIIVESDKNENPIATFLEHGESISKSLLEYYEDELKNFIENNNLTPKEFRFLGDLPFNFAIGVKFEESNLDSLQLFSQDGWFIFAPELHANADFHFEREKASYRGWHNVLEQKENEMFLNDLLEGNEDSIFFQSEASGSIENINSPDASERNATIWDHYGLNEYNAGSIFMNLFQENRVWSKGGLRPNTNGKYDPNGRWSCLSGCAPVAWAILLEYYDRIGYPNIIPGSSHGTTHSNIRWTINELRGWLKTTCRIKNYKVQGITSRWNMTRGEYYIRSRGYKTSVSNTYFSSAWWTLMGSIDRNEPVIGMIDSTRGKNGTFDHAVVAHSFKDYWGSRSDKFKVKYGHKGTKDAWINKSDLYGVTAVKIWN